MNPLNEVDMQSNHAQPLALPQNQTTAEVAKKMKTQFIGSLYDTSFIGNYIEKIMEIHPTVISIVPTTIDEKIRAIKTQKYAGKTVMCSDITSTVNGKDKLDHLASQIEVIAHFLTTLAQSNTLPKHFRGIVNINTNHFIGFNIEFTENEIKFSLLNTLGDPVYKPYSKIIEEILTKAFNNPVFKGRDIKRCFKEETIQQKGSMDCGALILEWLSVDLNIPKVNGEPSKNTPHEELLNDALYIRDCAKNNYALRLKQFDFAGEPHISLMEHFFHSLKSINDLHALCLQYPILYKVLAGEKVIFTHLKKPIPMQLPEAKLKEIHSSLKTQLKTAGPNVLSNPIAEIITTTEKKLETPSLSKNNLFALPIQKVNNPVIDEDDDLVIIQPPSKRKTDDTPHPPSKIPKTQTKSGHA